MTSGALGKLYRDGEDLVREGELGDCMYVIQEGKADVLVRRDGEEVLLRTASKGEIIGEMAILQRVVRSATVRARGDLHALTVDKKNFLTRINDVAERQGGRRLQRIESLAIHPSLDLGMFAGELARGEHGELELSSFLKLFIRTFSSGAGTREADLLSYLLFDTSFTRPLAELGHADALAREEELVAFFTD